MELDKTNTQVYLNYLLSQHTLSLNIIIQKFYLDRQLNYFYHILLAEKYILCSFVIT